MEIKGIFVTKISKVEAQKCFSDIKDKYKDRATLLTGSSRQQSAILKQYCHDLNEMIDKVFCSEMYGANRCKKRIDKLKLMPVDGAVLTEIFGIIIDLRKIVDDGIPINELPSCKSLTTMGVTDAISASKDLVKNNIVKSIIGVLLTAVNAGKIIGVIDVRKYYNEQKEELLYEIEQEKREPSEIELFLMDKYEAEIGYCNLAGLKVGLSGFKEIVDLTSNAQKAIDKFNDRDNVATSIAKA